MLILLDIDGVMVPAKSWKRPEFLNDGFFAFSSDATSALQKIISETSADILLTTSHKSKYTIQEWKNIFNLRGINVKNIYSLPENVNFLSRKDEIMKWVNVSLDLPDFIIVDDDKSLNTLPSFVKNKLVQTSASIGLTYNIAIETLQLIEKETYTFA